MKYANIEVYIEAYQIGNSYKTLKYSFLSGCDIFWSE